MGLRKKVVFKENSSGLQGITESKVVGSHGCSFGIEMYLLLRAKQFFLIPNPSLQDAKSSSGSAQQSLGNCRCYREGFALTTD